MAVATIWTLSSGTNQQQHLSRTYQNKYVLSDPNNQKLTWLKVKRNISVFLQGLITIIADLLVGKGIHLNNLCPLPSFSLNTS